MTVGLQLVLVEVGPKVAGVGTFVQTWGASLAEVDGKDVAAAGEGTWRRQEDAVIQSAETGASVVGDAKGAVVVEDEGGDEQLQGKAELVLVEAQQEVHHLALEMWQAFVLKSLNPQFCLIRGLERGHMQVAAA